jgi:hypothetical protein
MIRPAHHRRRGTTSVEFGIACPIVFFLIFATIVGGIGVFRYQQVASLAREGRGGPASTAGILKRRQDSRPPPPMTSLTRPFSR